MRIEYKGKIVEIYCSMCGNKFPEYIAPETNEPLCEKCAYINEDIKTNYPHKKKYVLRKINVGDIPLIVEALNKLKEIQK